MQPLIQVQGLCKSYRVLRRRPGLRGALANLFHPHHESIRAVREISFTINPGELVGYLGPNGAGKSTTIRILSGLLVPDSGEVQVGGLVPWQNRETYVRGIGAVFGNRSTLWWDLPVLDSLELMQPMYRIPAATFARNLSEFSEVLELGPFINRPVRTLSLGQRMRADLVAALLHDPAILFLDEPTIGLDVVARERVRQFIRHVNQTRGTTVLLTTHDLNDIEKLCERIMIIDQGSLLYDGSLHRLNDRYAADWILEARIDEEGGEIALPGLPPPTRTNGRYVFRFDPRQMSSTEMMQLLLARWEVSDLEIHRPPVEDTIRRIYEERLLQPGGTNFS